MSDSRGVSGVVPAAGHSVSEQDGHSELALQRDQPGQSEFNPSAHHLISVSDCSLAAVSVFSLFKLSFSSQYSLHRPDVTVIDRYKCVYVCVSVLIYLLQIIKYII